MRSPAPSALGAGWGEGMLVAMKGPPAAGKSTVARALSRRLGWPLIDKDDIKDILDGQTPPAGALAYEVMLRVARRQLSQGLSVICDSPLLARTYDGMHRVSQDEEALLAVVECRCSDVAIWRERVEGRQMLDLPAHHTVTWEGVQRFLGQPEASYPIHVPHLIVDTTRPLAGVVEEVVGWLEWLKVEAARGSIPPPCLQ